MPPYRTFCFFQLFQFSVFSTIDLLALQMHNVAPDRHFYTSLKQVQLRGIDPTEGGVPKRSSQGFAIPNPDRGRVPLTRRGRVLLGSQLQICRILRFYFSLVSHSFLSYRDVHTFGDGKKCVTYIIQNRCDVNIRLPQNHPRNFKLLVKNLESEDSTQGKAFLS